MFLIQEANNQCIVVTISLFDNGNGFNKNSRSDDNKSIDSKTNTMSSDLYVICRNPYLF